MIKHTLKKLPKNTVEIMVEIPWERISDEYKKSFAILHADFAFEGFRKGKVPREIAEKHIKKDYVYSHLIHALVPQVYEDIIKKEGLQPLINPKIDLAHAKENEAWKLKIEVAEKPAVDLKNWKKAVQEAKKAAKTAEIWVPGKDKAPEETDKQKQQDKELNAALSALLKEAACDISPLIIENELTRRLTQLADDIQKLGLTVDSYLTSKGLTMDKLRQQLSDEITQTYKIEFVLMAVADAEKITVEQTELDKLFTNIKTDKEREAAQANAYFYASVLRKQKVLDFLISL